MRLARRSSAHFLIARRFIAFPALVVGAALSGCTSTGSSFSQQASPLPPAAPAGSLTETLRRVVQANSLAATYDRAVLTARHDDAAGFRAACAQLTKGNWALEAVKLADQNEVGAAERALAKAMSFVKSADQGSVSQASWKSHADKLFQRVLELDPNFDSADPEKLGALGYVLAETGRSANDFKQAERLIGRSVEIWDAVQAQMPLNDKRRPEIAMIRAQLLNTLGYTLAEKGQSTDELERAEFSTRRSLEIWDAVLLQMSLDDKRRPELEMKRAQLSRDSLAWVLYKQGRFSEALIQQERAVEDETRLAATGNLPRTADLHYHLGEIERALKLYERARRHYREALKIDPQHMGSLNALKSMSGGSV